MASRRLSLSAWLTQARAALKAPPAQRPRQWTLVVGNESADLDSILSAVLLAYVRTYTPPFHMCTPLAAIPRADLPLRPELAVALRHTGITPEDIPTLDDVPEQSHPYRLLLVDHNSPTGRFALSQPNPPTIRGCIDHHADEGVTPPDAKPRIIETAGSCTSLVLRYCNGWWDKLDADNEMDAVLGKLALAPVLVDTGCLRVESRTEAVDKWAVKAAEGFMSATWGGELQEWRKSYDRESLYEELQRVKGDVSGMGLRDVLRRDYKCWKEGEGEKRLVLGVSSIPQGLEQLLARPGEGKDAFLKAVKSWASEQELDVIAVMTTLQKEAKGDDGFGGGFGRELLVWAVNPRGVSAAKLFAEQNGERLGLKTWKHGDLDLRSNDGTEWRACWDQEKTDCSRKQVGPWLREAMKASIERS